MSTVNGVLNVAMILVIAGAVTYFSLFPYMTRD